MESDQVGTDGIEGSNNPARPKESQQKLKFIRSTGFVADSSTDKTPDRPVEPIVKPRGATKIEILVPKLPTETRSQYEVLEDNVIGTVLEELVSVSGDVSYHVEFTDGHEDKILHKKISKYENGRRALLKFYNQRGVSSLGKRTRSPEDNADLQEEEEEEEEERLPQPDLIDLDDHSDIPVRRRLRKQVPQTRRTLRATAPRHSLVIDYEDDMMDDQSSPDMDSDSTALGEADIFLPLAHHRRKKREERPLRQSGLRFSASRSSSPDSDFEYTNTPPRRSSRANKTTIDMADAIMLDDDPISAGEEKPGIPRVVSVREVFAKIRADSPFASCHLTRCHACGRSSDRDRLVYCQGCSLTWHKACIGSRAARAHIVTKVGEQNFVLQCRLCIDLSSQKDKTAPRSSLCQECKLPGRSCAAFSTRKTTKQEEELREENGGIDPITQVSQSLLDNPELVMFRCVECHRGWHFEHLPPLGQGSVIALTTSDGGDHRTERLKDYSMDWTCNQCSLSKRKIHRLVAWRPTEACRTTSSSNTWQYSDISEDDREYLIKWWSSSYYHCSWEPAPWVYGMIHGTVRRAFQKRDLDQNLMKLTKDEAIPEEFLIPEIIMDVNFDRSIPEPVTHTEELDNISNISSILIKYKGLGYDDTVWDSPPGENRGNGICNAFREAFHDYLEGKYFKGETKIVLRARREEYKRAPFKAVDQQPAGLIRGKLMSYQIQGLNWMLQNYHESKNIVLADEMGLGKTVQVISLVTSLIQDNAKIWPFLIVVPNSTCANWRREFKQWTPNLRVVTYHGGKVSQELAYKYELFPNECKDMKAHVVIMSFDSAADPRVKSLFKDVHWQGLVVDEGQRLKNDRNLLYLSLKSMKIPFRLLLTGTPLQNNKRELFNLIQFIDQTQDANKLDEEFAILDKETLPKLHERIRPYFLRRTKAGVLKFLPPMAQIILPVTMTVIQEKVSKSIMAQNPKLIKSIFANSKMKQKEKSSLSNIVMQLRKVLCHPFVYSNAIEEQHHDEDVVFKNLVEASAKLILLQIMLPKLKERGHRVLIFSQFLNQLDIIEDFLGGLGMEFRYERLDGSLNSLEKQRRIDAFNAPDSELFAFLLSTRAGGVGINLATADTVIIMDPDFNPHQDIQALSRAHRIGQKQKVVCFQLVTKDSVEERIMQIGRKKMALDHALIESMDDYDIAGEDLESILKHGAQALFNDDYQKDAIHYDSASVEKLLDCSQIERTQTNDDGGGSAEFTFAQVWANDKSGFEADLAETVAPETMSSSVWDRILAEREEEARKDAEANKEVLGRGGRRRKVTGSYKMAGDLMPLLGDMDENLGGDDSDQDFGADPADEDESDDDQYDDGDLVQGKRLKKSPQSPEVQSTSQDHDGTGEEERNCHQLPTEENENEELDPDGSLSKLGSKPSGIVGQQEGQDTERKSTKLINSAPPPPLPMNAIQVQNVSQSQSLGAYQYQVQSQVYGGAGGVSTPNVVPPNFLPSQAQVYGNFPAVHAQANTEPNFHLHPHFSPPYPYSYPPNSQSNPQFNHHFNPQYFSYPPTQNHQTQQAIQFFPQSNTTTVTHGQAIQMTNYYYQNYPMPQNPPRPVGQPNAQHRPQQQQQQQQNINNNPVPYNNFNSQNAQSRSAEIELRVAIDRVSQELKISRILGQREHG